MSLRLCVVVVTFNRKELLGRCLTALQGQSRAPDAILVVDNASTDGTREMLRQGFLGVAVLELPRNLGASGGFHAGMQWAHQRGFDWIWVMDDDSLPCATALERLLEEARRHNPACEGPLALWGNVVAEDPPPACPPGEPDAADRENRIVPHAMFVGFAVPRQTIDRIGLPRRDFFLYCDDVEYCLRLRRAGGRTIRVGGSFVYHKDWQAHVLHKRVLGLAVSYPDIPAWRVYYLLRNHLLTYKRLGALRTLRCLARCGAFLLKSLLVKGDHAPYILLAAAHGLWDVSGPRVSPGPGAKKKA